jgi:hypothetical protein
MASATTELALPPLVISKNNTFASLASLGAALAAALRRRWIYRKTLSELEGYSERALLDIGAAHGIDAFARRAAGL